MYKWALFALLIVSGALGLGVLFFEEISVRQAAAAAEKASGPTVKVVATNFQFDKPEYTAKAGEKKPKSPLTPKRARTDFILPAKAASTLNLINKRHQPMSL